MLMTEKRALDNEKRFKDPETGAGMERFKKKNLKTKGATLIKSVIDKQRPITGLKNQAKPTKPKEQEPDEPDKKPKLLDA